MVRSETAPRPVSLEKAIVAFGGTVTSLARAIEASMTTVHGWKRRGRIPPIWEREIGRRAKWARKDVFVEGVEPPPPPKIKRKSKRNKRRT